MTRTLSVLWSDGSPLADALDRGLGHMPEVTLEELTSSPPPSPVPPRAMQTSRSCRPRHGRLGSI